MEAAISVEIAHEALRHAIEGQLHSALREEGWEGIGGRRIVVTTTRDLSPADCAERSLDGSIVVVLAAFPSSDGAAQYRAAGALYDGMQAGDMHWLDALKARLSAAVPCASPRMN